MKCRRFQPLALLLAGLVSVAVASRGAQAPAPAGPADRPGSEQAPGVRIERADPAPAAERRRRLAAWRELYLERLRPLRGASDGLFEALGRSSLTHSAAHCERLAELAAGVDREGLFSSSEVNMDRVLFGSLERFESGAAECLAGRVLKAYRLLHEAQAGLEWIDRRLASRLRPPIPLRGLE